MSPAPDPCPALPRPGRAGCSDVVSPAPAALGAVEEERHALLSAGREEDCLLVAAGWAAHVLCPRQCGVRPHVLRSARRAARAEEGSDGVESASAEQAACASCADASECGGFTETASVLAKLPLWPWIPQWDSTSLPTSCSHARGVPSHGPTCCNNHRRTIPFCALCCTACECTHAEPPPQEVCPGAAVHRCSFRPPAAPCTHLLHHPASTPHHPAPTCSTTDFSLEVWCTSLR